MASRRSTMVLGLAALLVPAGPSCTRRPDDAPGAPAASPLEPVPGTASEPSTGSTPVTAAVPSGRRCGEVGAVPTPPPPGLLHGVEPIGRAPMGPGDTHRFGNVDVEYHRSLDFGTTEVLVREPGVTAVIDRSVEPIDGAWGSRSIVPTEQPLTFGVGDYRVELHPMPDSGSPPRLDVRVLRRGCPPGEAADWPDGELSSMWLGNTAMVSHYLSGSDGRINPVIQEQAAGSALTLRWSYSSTRGNYHDALALAPDAVGRRISGLGVEAHVARIEPGEGVGFEDGRWSSASGTPQVAVRVDVRRLPPVELAPWPSADGPGCGEPSTVEQPLPVAAASTPKRAGRGRVTVGVGTPVTLHGLELSLTHTPAEERPGGRSALPESWLLSAEDGHGRTLDNMTLFAGRTPSLRVDDALLLLEPDKPPRFDPVRVRRLQLRCPEEWTGPMEPGSQSLWLGTLGIQKFSFMPAPLDYQLHAQLQADGAQVNLSVTTSRSEMAYYRSGVTPDDVGLRFWINEREVEIAAVEPGDGTRWDGNQWVTKHEAGPNVLVYLRLRPPP